MGIAIFRLNYVYCIRLVCEEYFRMISLYVFIIKMRRRTRMKESETKINERKSFVLKICLNQPHSKISMDWILDLLTTCTHDSELQAITALPLFSTSYSSP
jgi:hypothetical protein